MRRIVRQRVPRAGDGAKQPCDGLQRVRSRLKVRTCPQAPFTARCGQRGSTLHAAGMVAGRRRYPRSPAHARGRPAWAATVAASTPGVPCPRLGDREWGLRPRAPPPPCRHPSWSAEPKASVPLGLVVRLCGRRLTAVALAVAGSIRCSGGDAERISVVARERRAGERMPGPPACAPIAADFRERRQRVVGRRPEQTHPWIAGAAQRSGSSR